MDDFGVNFRVAVAAFAAMGVLLVFVVSVGPAHAKAFQISVSATGTAYAYPSSAAMYLLVNGSGSSTMEATSNISSTLKVLNYSLAQFIGGNLSDIKTTAYSLRKSYNVSRNEATYTATELLQVTIPEVGNVSTLLGTISAIQDVYVTSVSAQLTDAQISALRYEALSYALQNATAQAQTLAGGQVYVGNVTVNSFAYYPFAASGGFAASQTLGTSAGQLPGPIFSAGRSSVTESISAVFYRTG